MTWDFLFDRLVTWLLILQFAMILWNLRVITRPAARHWGPGAPLISLLVPARDEQGTIGRCVAHLLEQDYPNLEIVVLDDGSTDTTAAIVLAFGDPRVRLERGAPLPAGWTGKNWACHQLAQQARGRVLCFVDADTVVEPGAISAAYGTMVDHDAGLVSLLPRAERRSAGGALLLPMVSYAPYALFPTSLVHSGEDPRIAVAFGPFVMVSRVAYQGSGGHAAYPDHIVDDLQLARSVKADGHTIRLANGSDLVQTGWYGNTGEIWDGFSKNAYGALDYNPWAASAVLFLLVPLLLAPFLRIGFGAWAGDIPAIAVWQALLLIAGRAITAHQGRDRQWSTPLHAATVAFWGATLARSMVLSGSHGTATWKGREVPTRPVVPPEV